MNDIEKAIEDLKALSECKSLYSSAFNVVHGVNLELAISALEKQQEFNEYMEYMKQLVDDETKPLEDRQFAEKIIICFESFVEEVENE